MLLIHLYDGGLSSAARHASPGLLHVVAVVVPLFLVLDLVNDIISIDLHVEMVWQLLNLVKGLTWTHAVLLRIFLDFLGRQGSIWIDGADGSKDSLALAEEDRVNLDEGDEHLIEHERDRLLQGHNHLVNLLRVEVVVLGHLLQLPVQLSQLLFEVGRSLLVLSMDRELLLAHLLIFLHEIILLLLVAVSDGQLLDDGIVLREPLQVVLAHAVVVLLEVRNHALLLLVNLRDHLRVLVLHVAWPEQRSELRLVQCRHLFLLV